MLSGTTSIATDGPFENNLENVIFYAYIIVKTLSCMHETCSKLKKHGYQCLETEQCMFYCVLTV